MLPKINKSKESFLKTLMREGISNIVGEIVTNIAGPGCSLFLSACLIIIFDKDCKEKDSGLDLLRHVGMSLFISSVIRCVAIALVICTGLASGEILCISIILSATVKILMKCKPD